MDAIRAITLIDCSDELTGNVNYVETYPLPRGEERAREVFEEWVLEASGQKKFSPEEMDGFWDNGIYHIGAGWIMVVRS